MCLIHVDTHRTWIPLVRRLAKTYAARRFREDVTSETLLVIVRRLHRGQPIDRLAAFASTVVRRLAKLALVRERMHVPIDADITPAPAFERDALPTASRFRITSLRGHRQRWLCRLALGGWSCERMAEASGLELREVRAQVLELCEKIFAMLQAA